MGQTFHRLVPRPPPRLLSLVIPTYNEQAMVPVLRPILTEFLASLPYPAEAIFVNDGSSDQTLDLLLEWASADSNVKVLGLARNFGHQAAVTAGLDTAAGDAVVILDADLQDPLEVIPKMVDRYQQGYDVVYGQRVARSGETAFKRFTAWTFYRLMQKLVHPDLPIDTGDFRLISRSCLDAVASMRETHRFLRGMVAWAGFAQIAVQYSRSPRAAGQTKYPLRKMLKFAWTAAVSFSTLPLRMSLSFGLLIAFLGILYGLFAVIAKITGIFTAPGWTSQMVLISVLCGAILISNGILGEYIGRIFEELKDRPLYIVSSTANTPPPKPAPPRT
jgi:glycosyltransferase involved in cell wall biosynthesis